MAAKIDIGSRVVVTGHTANNCYKSEGREVTVQKANPDYGRERRWYINCSGDEKTCCYVYESDLKLISTKMSLKEKFVTAFLSEPEKTFRKAGITNGDGLMTDEGTQIFMTWLLKKNGDAFKTEVVDQLIAEEKE